jgi:hypothetical protein
VNKSEEIIDLLESDAEKVKYGKKSNKKSNILNPKHKSIVVRGFADFVDSAFKKSKTGIKVGSYRMPNMLTAIDTDGSVIELKFFTDLANYNRRFASDLEDLELEDFEDSYGFSPLKKIPDHEPGEKKWWT